MSPGLQLVFLKPVAPSSENTIGPTRSCLLKPAFGAQSRSDQHLAPSVSACPVVSRQPEFALEAVGANSSASATAQRRGYCASWSAASVSGGGGCHDERLSEQAISSRGENPYPLRCVSTSLVLLTANIPMFHNKSSFNTIGAADDDTTIVHLCVSSKIAKYG